VVTRSDQGDPVMKQGIRHNVRFALGGILGGSFSLAAQAASLGPGAPAGAVSGAAWGTAPGSLPPAATLLAWAPLLLLAALGAILAILIWLQPGAPASGERHSRRHPGKLRVSLAASGPAASVETWRSAVPAPQAPANGSLQRAAAEMAFDGAADGTPLISALKR
jgi:hypothetical protein